MGEAGTPSIFIFRSKTTPYLAVPGESYGTQTVIEGRTVVNHATPNFVFRNSVFTTRDPAIAEYLRNKSGWIGVFYVEDRLAQTMAKAAGSGAAPDAEKGIEVVRNIKSRNSAVAWLGVNKKADPATLANLSPQEVKTFALQVYKVDFPNWKP